MIRNCAIILLAATATAFSVERRQFFGQLAGAAALVAGAGEARRAVTAPRANCCELDHGRGPGGTDEARCGGADWTQSLCTAMMYTVCNTSDHHDG